jgi:type VI secretion system protein VasD
MRRREFLATSASLSLLAACGEEPPPDPTIVSVTATGAPGMNPAPDGTDRPATLFLARLKENASFNSADLFALQAEPATAIGAALVGIDQLVIAPGGSAAKTLTFEPEATMLGLIAVLRDPGGKVWRLATLVTPHQMATAAVTLGPKGIELKIT